MMYQTTKSKDFSKICSPSGKYTINVESDQCSSYYKIANSKNIKKFSKLSQQTSNILLNSTLNKDTTVEDLLFEDRQAVKLNIFINKDKEQILKNVTTEISKLITTQDLIIICVKSFNALFKEEKLNYELRTENINNYIIKASKKNGKPDNDLPGII